MNGSIRRWVVRLGLIVSVGALVVSLAACEDTSTARRRAPAGGAPVVQSAQPQVVTQAPTQDVQKESPSPAPPTEPPATVPAPEPGPQGLDRVQQATVYIVGQGTFEDPQVGQIQNVAGQGSGFLISADGYIVTANHVVTGAATLNVYVQGRREPLNARIIAASECSDLALIKLTGTDFVFLEFAERVPPVGTEIFVAGYQLGEQDYALVSGILSKADAPGDSRWASIDYQLQHDASATFGNSGGPVVMKDAYVIGVHHASRPAFNQGFAIGLPQIRPVLDLLMQGKNVEWVGINGIAVTSPNLSGIWVASVASGSPADRAGVRPGDVVIELENLQLSLDGTMGDYCDILRSRQMSDVMQIRVVRFSTGQVLEGQLNGRPLA